MKKLSPKELATLWARQNPTAIAKICVETLVKKGTGGRAGIGERVYIFFANQGVIQPAQNELPEGAWLTVIDLRLEHPLVSIAALPVAYHYHDEGVIKFFDRSKAEIPPMDSYPLAKLYEEVPAKPAEEASVPLLKGGLAKPKQPAEQPAVVVGKEWNYPVLSPTKKKIPHQGGEIEYFINPVRWDVWHGNLVEAKVKSRDGQTDVFSCLLPFDMANAIALAEKESEAKVIKWNRDSESDMHIAIVPSPAR